VVVALPGERRDEEGPHTSFTDAIDLSVPDVDMAEVQARITAALPGATALCQVVGARVPGVRLSVGGVGVDATVVPTGSLAPAEAVVRRAELGEAAAIALSAVSDAEAIRVAVGERTAEFAELARQVKAWARARGLDSAPFGGLPGIAWAVLAARTAREASGDLLEQFFATWAAWDWREPVALAFAAPRAGAAVCVLTPSAPVRSCTGQVSAGGRDLLAAELYRAWEIVESAADPWPELYAPPPLHRRHAAWAVVTVRASGAESYERALGRFRGRIRALLTALEDAGSPDAHAWPRPFAHGPDSADYAIGLGCTPPDSARLTELADRWGKGLPVEVRWMEGGKVPTLT
jgi:poly(A) polymerase Pap1